MSLYKKDFHFDCFADELKHWIIYIHSSIAEPSSVVNTSVYRGGNFILALVYTQLFKGTKKEQEWDWTHSPDHQSQRMHSVKAKSMFHKSRVYGDKRPKEWKIKLFLV